jgi:DNA-binding LacI/PurR family transcriptional regulator
MGVYKAGTVTRILSRPRRPTAVFTTSDSLALEAIASIAHHGLRIPDDIAIVGFDNIQLASHPLIGLTTVEESIMEQASGAVYHLLSRVLSEAYEPVTKLIPARLIVRRTCGYKR